MQLIHFILAAWPVTFLLTAAYRGKGGGWSDWGVRDWLLARGLPAKLVGGSMFSHLLAALFAALAAVVLTGAWAWTPLFMVLFLFGTKPDIGTGFAAFHGNSVLLYGELRQVRSVDTRWPWLTALLSAIEQAIFWPADALGRVTLQHSGCARLAGLAWMLGRGLFFVPYIAAIGFFGSGICPAVLVLVPLFFATAYAVGAVQTACEEVEFSEYTMGPCLALAALLEVFG